MVFKLSMPVPQGSSSTPFLTSLATSLGFFAPDLIYGLDPISISSAVFSSPTTAPFFLYSGGGKKASSNNMYVVPNPFGDENLPTIFVGGVSSSFQQKNIFEQYLQGFKYLPWPEQLKLWQVSGGSGRSILSSTGICPDFANLSPMLLLT